MLYPLGIVSPTQLSTPYMGATVLVNNGPGNVYVYPSAAVSSAAYVAVIPSGGTLSWSGGELWGIADAAGTTVTNGVGLAAVDSGSTKISGTVTTVAASSSGGTVAPTVHGSMTTNSAGASSRTISVPVGTVANDLMMCVVLATASQAVSISQSGWSTVLAPVYDTSTHIQRAIFSKIVTAGEVSGQNTYTVVNPSANEIECTVVSLAGVTTLTQAFDSASGTSGYSAGITSSSKNIVIPINWSALGVVHTTWANSGSGGPSTAPTISHVDNSANDVLTVSTTIPTWDTATLYGMGASGSNFIGDVYLAA